MMLLRYDNECRSAPTEKIITTIAQFCHHFESETTPTSDTMQARNNNHIGKRTLSAKKIPMTNGIMTIAIGIFDISCVNPADILFAITIHKDSYLLSKSTINSSQPCQTSDISAFTPFSTSDIAATTAVIVAASVVEIFSSGERCVVCVTRRI